MLAVLFSDWVNRSHIPLRDSNSIRPWRFFRQPGDNNVKLPVFQPLDEHRLGAGGPLNLGAQRFGQSLQEPWFNAAGITLVQIHPWLVLDDAGTNDRVLHLAQRVGRIAWVIAAYNDASNEKDKVPH